MKSIEEYAIDLVVRGVETYVDNENDEDCEISSEDLQAACDLAVEIAHAISDNPDAALALVREKRALLAVLRGALADDWEIDSSGYAKAAQAVMAAGWTRTNG